MQESRIGSSRRPVWLVLQGEVALEASPGEEDEVLLELEEALEVSQCQQHDLPGSKRLDGRNRQGKAGHGQDRANSQIPTTMHGHP